MPRSAILLLVLLAAGIFTGVSLSHRAGVAPGPRAAPQTPAPVAAPDLNGAASAITALAAGADPQSGPSAGEDPQIKVLKEQVAYLEKQVQALQKENSDLIDKLASLTRKPEAAMPAVPPQPPPPCGPGSTTPVPEEPDFVGIGIELIRLRGIQDIPIPTMTVPRPEVEKRIAKWLQTQVPPEYGKVQGRAFAALGAIPQPVDTMALKAAFLSYQIGGWYDAAEGTLFLATPDAEGLTFDADKENALALSYGCLQKRFGPSLYGQDRKALTLDARLSRDSLLAGDAALLRFLHALQNPKKGGGGGVGEDPDDPSRSVPIPNFLREVELLPFTAGFDFMQSMHSIGEWDQVNAAYQRPPIAGAEILEPRLYLSETPFTLRTLEIPDVSVKGVKPYWRDTLGPMVTVVLLKQRVPAAIAADTAQGWTNDQCMTYAAEGNSRDHVVWQTLWRDTDAADAFFSAARQWLLNRYKNAKPPREAVPGVFRLEAPGRVAYLQRTHDGKGVVLIDAADAEFAKAAVAKFATGHVGN